MKAGRPKIPDNKRRMTYAVTILPGDIDFIHKHNFIGSQIWDWGIEYARAEVKEQKNLEKFNETFPKIRKSCELYIDTFEYPDSSNLPIIENMDGTQIPPFYYKQSLLKKAEILTERIVKFEGFETKDDLFEIFKWEFERLYKNLEEAEK